MRYSLMLQVVGTITVILVGSTALFAWLQSRHSLEQNTMENSLLQTPISLEEYSFSV